MINGRKQSISSYLKHHQPSKMEVCPEILEKLLCSVCGEYLSCAPVRMKNDGAALCGRCCDPEGETTLHITPYEHLAKMLVFPCANKTHGCTETLYMAEVKEHEEECEYRQYVCPVTESGQCAWSGARKNILDHCKEQHPDKLLQDPYTIQHQINETNHKTFLLAAFQMLFLIHCKVCITTKSVYHSVRLIGKSALADNYEYVVKMLNKKKKLSMSRDVAPQGCMSLQEDMSVHVDFNTMLKFLGDIKDTIFKIKVGRKCVKCKKCVIAGVWPTDEGWCCMDCAPATRQCEFNSKSCSYTDTDMKADKHEAFYCQYSIGCVICGVTGPREQHYASAHSDVTYKAGAMWRAPVVNKEKDVHITSDVGVLDCDYVSNDSQFLLRIWSPLHTEQLSDYRCAVKLRNPDAGYALRQILSLKYSLQWDWEFRMNKDDFLMYVNDNEFDIKIELIKKIVPLPTKY